MSDDAVQAPADLTDRLLSWARELGDDWFTAEQAAAIGGTEDEARSALAVLEAEGLPTGACRFRARGASLRTGETQGRRHGSRRRRYARRTRDDRSR